MENDDDSHSDWVKGIGLYMLASVIGGASKLAIRKSWLLSEETSSSPHGGAATTTVAGEGGGRIPGGDVSSTVVESFSIESLPSAAATTETTPRSSAARSHRRHHRRTSVNGNGNSTRKCFEYALRWSGMFGMSVLNPACCVLAMNYASPSVLAPFSGLTLVCVVVCSYPVLGEKPSRSQVVAASLIVAGEVVVAFFGDHTNDAGETVEEVRTSYSDPLFLSYFAALSVYVALLLYWMYLSDNHFLRKFAWGNCGGSLAGLQNFLKDSLTIRAATAADQPYPTIFWWFLAAAMVSAFGGLLVLTACLRRYDATYSAATFVGSFVVSASAMSAAHYKTFQELNGLSADILYPFGLFVLIVGVFIFVGESRGGETWNNKNGADGIHRDYDPVRKNSDFELSGILHPRERQTDEWLDFEFERGDQPASEQTRLRRNHRSISAKEKSFSAPSMDGFYNEGEDVFNDEGLEDLFD